MSPRRADGPWLSVSGAARALGVSPSTLRLWASEDRIPHVRTAGGHRRFDPEALRQWLAQQPSRPTRPARRVTARVTRSPALAAVVRERATRVAEEVESLVEGTAEVAFRRLPPADRRAVVRAWMDALADAFESGNLADALERAEVYGRGHGLAGSSADVTLGGSLALERALDRALTTLDEGARHELVGAMSQLTVRVATAWAAAVAGRGARHAGEHRPAPRAAPDAARVRREVW
ncbi:MAG: helix-turn-helix domain-containing protein [Thermoleophilia bacterium]|nr:helix-turn-helix domain-containing protein [Thermoleophilia bacterium]